MHKIVAEPAAPSFSGMVTGQSLPQLTISSEDNGMPFLANEIPQIPGWAWGGALVGFVVTITILSPKILQIWKEWSIERAAQRKAAREEAMAIEKDRIAIANAHSEPFRLALEEIKEQLETVRAKAEETERAHLKDRLADHEIIVKCREECATCKAQYAACRSELDALKAQKGIG